MTEQEIAYRPPAKLMRIELSSVCDYRCRFCCWQNNDAAVPFPRFTPDQVRALCRGLAASGCNNVNITGGEPLLLPIDYLCGTIAAMQSVDGVRRLWATTNGSALRDPDFCERLAGAGLRELAVSIAAATDESYLAYTGSSVTLSQILRGISNAVQSDMAVRVHVPLSPVGVCSFGQLETLLDKAAESGVTEAFYFGMHNSEKIEDGFSELYVDPEIVTDGFHSSDRWHYGETETGRPYFTDGNMRVSVPRETIRLVTDNCEKRHCGSFCQGIYSAYCVPGAQGWTLRACHRIFADRNNEYPLSMDLLDDGREAELASLLRTVWRYAYEEA